MTSILRAAEPVALSHLLKGLVDVPASADVRVCDIALDSRQVTQGSCFFALRGARENGMRYAVDAARRGAVAIVAEDDLAQSVPGLPVLNVPQLRLRLGHISNRFFASPSAAVRVFAVTGTNGKTTVAHLTAQAVKLLEGACGYIGTLGAGPIEELETGINTTPDVVTINRWLARLRSTGIRAITLEASSHALDQRRLDGVQIHTAAFTNLGHDHLDYHAGLAEYATSKRRLFTDYAIGAAVINVDDALGMEIAASLPSSVRLWCCSSSRRSKPAVGVQVIARDIKASLSQTTFVLEAGDVAADVTTRLLGRFNVDNLLIISGMLLSAGHSLQAIAAALGRLDGVPGRLEPCGTTPRGARIYIDYAHSPDSLEAVLCSLRELAPGKVHLVFGCGGNRDRTKRPLMGALAERYADAVIITADNPREESTHQIAHEITAGMRSTEKCRVIHDREEAIAAAIEGAPHGALILIAGKGHETTQEAAGETKSFSDRDCVRATLQSVRS